MFSQPEGNAVIFISLLANEVGCLHMLFGHLETFFNEVLVLVFCLFFSIVLSIFFLLIRKKLYMFWIKVSCKYLLPHSALLVPNGVFS